MRVVLQRVKQAHVEVAGESKGRIGPGLLILLGVTHADGRADADYLADKILHLRIFPDDQRRMNRSVLEAGGSLLVVSQFTLYGSCKKGRRPSFDQAAPPEQARDLYEYFVGRLQVSNTNIETGVFQAEMEVYLVNDGPVDQLPAEIVISSVVHHLNDAVPNVDHGSVESSSANVINQPKNILVLVLKPISKSRSHRLLQERAERDSRQLSGPASCL